MEERTVYDASIIDKEENKRLGRKIKVYDSAEPTHALFLKEQILEEYYELFEKTLFVFHYCENCGSVFKVVEGTGSEKDYRMDNIEEASNLDLSITDDLTESDDSDKEQQNIGEETDESDGSDSNDTALSNGSNESGFKPDESVFEDI